MNVARPGGVVIDTMVFSWLTDQTASELRYGALRAGWGELRTRRLERRIAAISVSQPDDATITLCAQLRDDCRKLGHPLAAKVHDGDRWIAATALRLGVPLVSKDGIFKGAPRVDLLTAT